MKPPRGKKNVLFTDPGTFCSCAKEFSACKKVVCWWHGDKNTRNKGIKKRLPIAKKYMPTCEKVIVSCDHGYNAVVELGVNLKRIVKIPLGVDLSLFKASDKSKSRNKFAVPKSSFCVGSFQRDTDKRGGPKFIKGPDVFVDVINRVKQSIPNLFVLLSGRRRDYVIKKLKGMKVPYAHHRVNFDEMPNLYSCLDCYLMTSRVEGGPKSLMESIACGIPIVASNCGMSADVIQDGVNGFMTPQDDAELMADRIMQIYNNGLIVDVSTVLPFDYKSNIVGLYNRLFDKI